MSISTQINYDTSGNFTFDSSKVEFISGLARLKLQTSSQVFTQDYASSVEFTYDTIKAEFQAGQIRQKSQIPANAVLGITYLSTKNANWVGPTATDVGTPTLSGGYLICAGGNNGCYYNSSVIGNITNVGTFKFKFRPNYTGAPSSIGGIFHLSVPSDLTGVNHISLTHWTSSRLKITARNSAGSLTHLQVDIGPNWTPVAGQTYEMELVLDTLVTGIRLFIDGVLWGTLSTTYTRTNTATRMYIGSNPSYTPVLADFKEVVVFSNIQHTANYTPGYSLSTYVYAETSTILPAFTHPLLGTILSLVSLAEPGVSPRFTISLNGGGTFLYWNGSAWVASDGTFTQSTALSTFNTNIFSLSVSGLTSLTLKLHFQDSDTVQGTASNTVLSYTGNSQYPIDNPTVLINASTAIDDLLSFSAVIANTVRFALQKNGVSYYHNGSIWTISSGYAQTNTAAEILAAVDNFTAVGITFKPLVYLNSSGNDQSSITSVSFSYDFFVVEPSSPNKCLVYGFVDDILGIAWVNATTPFKIRVTLEAHFISSGHFVNRSIKEFTTDSLGYFEADLIETATVAKKYLFQVIYRDLFNDSQTYDLGRVEIPNQISINFTSLTFT